MTVKLLLRYLTNVLLGCVVIVAISIGYSWFRIENDDTNEIADRVIVLDNDLAYYQSQIDKYTVEDVLKKIEDDEIDIISSLSKKRQELTLGLERAYDETKILEDYEKLEENLPPLLGEDLSEQVIRLNEPVINQSGEIQFPVESITDLNVAFGKYDHTKRLAQCIVTIDYNSPILTTGDGTEVSITSKDLFILEYSVKDDEISLLDYQKGNQEQEGDLYGE